MVTSISSTSPPAESRIELDGIPWELYEQIRQSTDDQHSHVRIWFDSGRMVLMSPSKQHELTKRRIGRLIETATLELRIPICSLGSATWKRRDLAKGLEADECYYIQHESQVRGRQDWDVSRHPPDLVVEVDISNSSRDRESIYAALGVNEIWRFDADQTTFLKLTADNRYAPIDRSDALPRLTPADIDRHLAMFSTTDETSIIRAFAQWLRSAG